MFSLYNGTCLWAGVPETFHRNLWASLVPAKGSDGFCCAGRLHLCLCSAIMCHPALSGQAGPTRS